MPNQPLKLLTKDSMLATIHGSVGSSMFQKLYADVNGERVDILRDGEESCAYYISAILHHFKLVTDPHATVSGLIRDMESHGWERAETPEAGDVLIWEAIHQVHGIHSHCGFYIGNEQAVSNDFKLVPRVPRIHHYTDELPARAITAIYRHPSLTL